MQGSIWVRQMRTSDTHQVSPPSHEDRIDVICYVDIANAHRLGASVVAYTVRESNLEHTAINRLILRDGLARRNVENVRTSSWKGPHQIHCIFGLVTIITDLIMRKMSLPVGHAARIALNTSRGKPRRFSKLPRIHPP